MPLEQVTAEKTLETDLNLDSLGRVGLLSAVEAELGVYLDESDVGPGTTVQQIEHMVEERSTDETRPRFPAWGMSLWCRMLRGLLQRAVVFPLLRLTYRLKVVGSENLEDLPGPVLFTANHNLFPDNGLILKAMPLKVRRRLAIAAAAEAWRNPVWAVANPLVGNGFPFSREGAVCASLENLGRILDSGWSVLIYPEGGLTIGGPIQPFKSGSGLIGVEGRLPVVPVRLHIHSIGSPRLIAFLRRGDIEVRFGRPFTLLPGTDYEEATATIEQAVKGL